MEPYFTLPSPTGRGRQTPRSLTEINKCMVDAQTLYQDTFGADMSLFLHKKLVSAVRADSVHVLVAAHMRESRVVPEPEPEPEPQPEPEPEEQPTTPKHIMKDLATPEFAGLSTKAVRDVVRGVVSPAVLKAVVKAHNSAQLRDLTVPAWMELWPEDARPRMQMLLNENLRETEAAPPAPEPKPAPKPKPSPKLKSVSVQEARKAVLQKLSDVYAEALQKAEGWLIQTPSRFAASPWSCMIQPGIAFHSLRDEEGRFIRDGCHFFPCIFGSSFTQGHAAGIGLRTFKHNDRKVSLLSGASVPMKEARKLVNNPCIAYLGKFTDSSRAPAPTVDALVERTAYKALHRVKIGLLSAGMPETKPEITDAAAPAQKRQRV